MSEKTMKVVLSNWHPIGNLTEPFNLSRPIFKSKYEWISFSYSVANSGDFGEIHVALELFLHPNSQTLRRDYKTTRIPLPRGILRTCYQTYSYDQTVISLLLLVHLQNDLFCGVSLLRTISFSS